VVDNDTWRPIELQAETWSSDAMRCEGDTPAGISYAFMGLRTWWKPTPRRRSVARRKRESLRVLHWSRRRSLFTAALHSCAQCSSTGKLREKGSIHGTGSNSFELEDLYMRASGNGSGSVESSRTLCPNEAKDGGCKPQPQKSVWLSGWLQHKHVSLCVKP
jgi:hypothetical protein